MINVILNKRAPDAFGSGEYGASRGSRTHVGVDYACSAGASIASPVDGEVTKLGYPYGDDLSYRYVEVTAANGAKHRVFYCEPSVSVSDLVSVGDKIGEAQDIAKRYNTADKQMNNHVHYEIKDVYGNFVNPETY
jgi:murein DD-endopeptidase MepM/ murein hydrolase activator NlpD